MDLQTALREFRKARRLMQKEVAAELGISLKHYSRIEEGKDAPSWGLLKRIREVTGIKIEFSLERDK